MKNIKLYAVLFLFVGFIGLSAGCNLTDVKVGKDGTVHTNLGDYMLKAGDIGKTSAPFLPGPLSIIVGGIAGLVGLAGTAATSILVARKRGGTLEAVIQGVEEANNPEVKKSIRNVAIDMGYQPYLDKVVHAVTPPSPAEVKPV